MSDTAAATFRRVCDATHTVVVCEPWVKLCRTTKTNGLTEAIVLGKVIAKLYRAEDNDFGEVDEGGQRWVYIVGSEWERDCFLSKSQVYRALEKLEALGFVAQRRAQRRQWNGALTGNPVRHVTLYDDAIGDALEALERGEWDPEPLLREVTSSRARDESGREGATSYVESSPRPRDQVAEADREDATSSARARDQASPNKEEIPPSNTSEDPSTSVPVVASDAGSGPEENTDHQGRSLTPQQILWATIARAFDWDPLVRDPDQKRQVVACASKLAKRQVTGAEIADRAWWFIAGTKGATPAMLGERWGTIQPDPSTVAHRQTAARVLASAAVDLGTGPSGRCERRQEAEREIASLLSAGETEEAIGQALRSCRTWTVKALGVALDGADRRRAVGSASITADDARRLPFGTLAGKLQDKRLGAEDRELLHDEVRLRVEATLGVDNGAPALDEQNGRLFTGIRWRVDETAITMRGLCAELRSRAGVTEDPAAAAGEAAFRAIAGATRPSTTRALTEGGHP